jgi:serine/threonine-protein kinase
MLILRSIAYQYGKANDLLPPPEESNQSDLNLAQLSILLEKKRWRQADLETERLLLIATNRYDEGWLDSTSLRALSCETLIAIDNLWETYTNERFSFKKQSEIWKRVANKPQEFDDDSYEKFGKTVGWYIPEDEKWLSADQLQYSLTSPPGHFPSGGKIGVWSFGVDGVSLLQRCYP